MATTPINTTTSTASSTYLNKTFYQRQLLELAKTILVHQQFGTKKTIPAHSGKTTEFRKSNQYTPDTESYLLTEGTVPTGLTYGQTHITSTLYSYGTYVAISDQLELTAYDDVVAENVDLIGEVIMNSIELVTRDALIGEASSQYAGANATMLAIDTTDTCSINEIRKAVATLKKAKAPKFSVGGQKPCYVAIVGPDVAYDLEGDSDWKRPNEYNGLKPIFSGELGMLYGVRFVDSTETYKTEQSVNNLVNATTSSSASFVLKNTPTDAEVEYLSTAGNKIKIGATVAGATEYTIASFVESTKTVTLTGAVTLTANHFVFSEDAGKVQTSGAGVPVHHTLVLGKDAFACIDVEGSGMMEIIIKPKESGGPENPLNQYGTVGAKVELYAAKVTHPLWVVDVMSAATLTNP